MTKTEIEAAINRITVTKSCMEITLTRNCVHEKERAEMQKTIDAYTTALTALREALERSTEPEPAPGVEIDRLKTAIANIAEGVDVLEAVTGQEDDLPDGRLTRLQSDRIALECMREVLEREQGCEYCKRIPPKDLIVIDGDDVDGEYQITVDIYGEDLRVYDNEFPGFSESEPIKYCPKCGRKLATDNNVGGKKATCKDCLQVAPKPTSGLIEEE